MRFLDRKQEQALDEWLHEAGGDFGVVEKAMRAVAAESGSVSKKSVSDKIKQDLGIG